MLPLDQDPQLKPGHTVRRPDPGRPFVAMSNRERWAACPGSAVLPQLRTPSIPAAEQGTMAHTVAEAALAAAFKLGDGRAFDLSTLTPPPGLRDMDYNSPAAIDAWRAQIGDFAQIYAAHARRMFSDLTSHTFAMIEAKLDDVVIEGVRVFTVADLLAWNPEAKRLVSGDYKFGTSPVGVGTAEHPNAQCAGAAVIWTDKQPPEARPEQVGLFVYQPRIRYGEAFQALAPLDAAWLDTQREKLHTELRAVASAARDVAAGRMPPCNPGDHCNYCPSAHWCGAAAQYGAAAIAAETGQMPVVSLTDDEVAALWAARSAFKQFEADLRERIEALHLAGSPVVTVSRRKGNRIWANPAAAVEALMLADRYDLLQPPGVDAGCTALDEFTATNLVTRAPDVITYKRAGGKDPATAAGAFAKYLAGGGA